MVLVDEIVVPSGVLINHHTNLLLKETDLRAIYQTDRWPFLGIVHELIRSHFVAGTSIEI